MDQLGVAALGDSTPKETSPCASDRPLAHLDRVYPAGADRAEGAKRTQRQQNELAYTRLRDAELGDLGLSAELRDSVGFRLSTAVGYDAYRVRVKRGGGYSASWRRYCDYVFFDESQEIVASFRREGTC